MACRKTLAGSVSFFISLFALALRTSWPQTAHADEELPDAAPPTPRVLSSTADDSEPDEDISWLNGSNHQPPSLLRVGPVVLSLYVDVFYAWQFHRPIDHTIFPSNKAPRHGELSINLLSFGMELPPGAWDGPAGGPIGQLSLQYGTALEANGGQDSTTNRGYYLSRQAFAPIRTASAGWHFPWLSGVNIEVGIFPSYMGLESSLSQENWNYNHSFVSEFTPFYFSGSRTQIFFTPQTKLELWLVNGWQTFGQWNTSIAGGYLATWRPTEDVSLTNSMYFGRFTNSDPDSLRAYSDSYIQFRYYQDSTGLLRSGACSLVFDMGYDKSNATDTGWIAGQALANRLEWGEIFATTVRGDLFYDHAQALLPTFPSGSPYTRPDKDRSFLGGGITATLDYLPSPWFLTRLEYQHRRSNIPLFSGSGGITGPGGTPASDPTTFVPDLRTHDNRIVLNATLRL